MTEYQFLVMALYALTIFLHLISLALQLFPHCQNLNLTKEAIASPHWQTTIADELAALQKNQT